MHWLIASEILKTIDFICPQDYDTIINMLISAIESRLREFHGGDNSKIPLIPIR